MFQIMPSARLRRSPFYDCTIRDGVKSFTTYNQMLMPTGYGDPEGEYWRLLNGVSMWDVAVERQVQLKGPDAATLAQLLSPRDLSKCKIGQGKYVALCNHAGTIINDPILLKRADDCYWFSIADSSILFWARAISAERGLNVKITEPDVSPLAVQGPKAEAVVASIFGDWVKNLRYFWFEETTLQDIPVAIARSGWSKQGGFEIYLMDGSKGGALWDIVREAGQPFDIAPGNPNQTERIESGLLSYGGDTDDKTNPFEIGMEPFVDLDVDDDVVGIHALRKINENGPKRHQLGVILNHSEPLDPASSWHEIFHQGNPIGHMTNSTWSYRLKRNIGYALVGRSYTVDMEVNVSRNGKNYTGTLSKVPFM